MRARASAALLMAIALVTGVGIAGTYGPAFAEDNMVQNPGFETSSSAPWTLWQDSTVQSEDTHSGHGAVRLVGEASADQVVTGLTGDTSYVLTAWAKTLEGGGPVALGVKGFDGGAGSGSAQNAADVTASEWTQESVPFHTAVGVSSVTIFCYRPDKPGAGLCDDFELTVQTLEDLAPAPPAPSESDPTRTDHVPLGIPGDWALVFADEFDGDSLNLDNWCATWVEGASCTEITDPVSLHELAAYDPDLVSVSGGTLKLTTAVDPVTIVSGTDAAERPQTYPYRSGLVQSKGPLGHPAMHEFTYGAFEAEIFLPTQGDHRIANWPRFWLAGEEIPGNGELRVVEGLRGQAHFSFHGPGDDGTGTGSYAASATGYFDQWHTFGARWQPGSVSYYYDGINVGTVAINITDDPMYLVINYAVGGAGGTVPLVPASMEVNYVRVWQTSADRVPVSPSSPAAWPWAWIVVGALVENVLIVGVVLFSSRRGLGSSAARRVVQRVAPQRSARRT